MTVARYWAVGSATESTIPFTAQGMSAHLMQDWLPSVPPVGGHLLIGWPALLTETHVTAGQAFLALKERAGYTERQWKGFLSWMVGVCGTREVLASEGYDWVAPASAFYPENKIKVEVGIPPTGFVPQSLSIAGDPRSASHLRPDYIALKGGSNADAWASALVEAKGVRWSLERAATCPPSWADQVRNAVIEYEGIRLQADRHLVVAVRSAPNAKRLSTRRFQIRAWNSETVQEGFTPGPFLDVVSASAYGLCRNLGLARAAEAISVANIVRRERQGGGSGPDRWVELAKVLAPAAVRELTESRPQVQTVAGRYEVVLEAETTAMIRILMSLDGADQIRGSIIDLLRLLRNRRGQTGQVSRPAPPLRIRRVED